MNSLTTPLGSVVRVQKGKPPLPPQDNDDRLPVLTPSLLRQQSSAEEFGSRKRGTELRDGELLCLWDGSNAGEFFRAIPGLLPSTMVRILCHDARINPGFLFLVLKSLEARLKSLTAGTGIPHVDKATFNAIPIPRLEPNHQMAVVAAIDLISNLIQILEQKIAKQERVRAGLLQALLTRGIDENGEIRDPRRCSFLQTKLGPLPTSWKVTSLGEVAEIIMGQSPPGSAYNDRGSGLPLINGPVEFGRRFPRKIQYTSVVTKTCEPEDVLFCVRGSTTGKMNIANDIYCIGRGVAAIRGKRGASISAFLELVLLSIAKDILDEARGSGSTFPSVNGPRLRSYLVPQPEVEEQVVLVETINRQDNLIDSSRRTLDKLHRLKTGLMRDLLSGEVSVEPLLDLPPFSSEKMEKP